MRKSTYFTKSELAMFKKQGSIFNDDQMKIINRKTPKSEIEIKIDKSGFKHKSVKAAYVKALVMIVTGGNFSFEVKSREFIPETREVLIEGRLILNSIIGIKNYRDQLGQHYLNSRLETSGNTSKSYPADIGNGYKAATSDAFKKCASEFGFCWDIYGQEHATQKDEEQPKLDHSETKKLERLNHFLTEAKTPDAIELVYNKYLGTSTETETSKDLLELHMNRAIKFNQDSTKQIPCIDCKRCILNDTQSNHYHFCERNGEIIIDIEKDSCDVATKI